MDFLLLVMFVRALGAGGRRRTNADGSSGGTIFHRDACVLAAGVFMDERFGMLMYDIRSSYYRLFRQAGDGSLEETEVELASAVNPTDPVAVYDVDWDGAMDLVVFVQEQQEFRVFSSEPTFDRELVGDSNPLASIASNVSSAAASSNRRNSVWFSFFSSPPSRHAFWRAPANDNSTDTYLVIVLPGNETVRPVVQLYRSTPNEPLFRAVSDEDNPFAYSASEADSFAALRLNPGEIPSKPKLLVGDADGECGQIRLCVHRPTHVCTHGRTDAPPAGPLPRP